MSSNLNEGADRAPKALRAFYGASDKQKRDNTAKSVICPGEREQAIDTPEEIVEGLLRFWGGIALDPCSSPSSIVPADVKFYVPPRIEVYHGRADGKLVEKTRTVFKAVPGEKCGLTDAWVDGTYANPPFKFLKDWLAKAQKEAKRTPEIIVLGPVRSQRKWWRAAARSATKVIYLDPVKFRGYRIGFPQGLCLMYWGEFTNLFVEAFEKLGEPIQ
jgi:hypothetical protein